MSEEVRRSGVEQPCMWFALCDQLTDIEVNHSILGWAACCERCAKVVDLEVPPPVSGWRVRATFTESGWKREKTQTFLNPLKAACLDNVQRHIELWHPKAEDLQLEVISPIFQGKTDSDWGRGAWLDTFKKQEPQT